MSTLFQHCFTAGIDSATSQYSCIWCKCSSEERYNPDTTWSITDPSQGARTIEENLELSTKRGKKFNVSRPPLFPMIPLSNVVIDNLHLFLRVADVLINLLIVELRRQDSIEKVNRFTCFDSKKYKHVDSFQQFVSSLGIPGYSFYIGKDSKALKVRSFTGPEKLKMFRNIRIGELLPKMDQSEVIRIQHLWDKFFCLNQIFSK